MTRYRVNFFWDWRGRCVTLWLRYCVLPEGFGPRNVSEGVWVNEKDSPDKDTDSELLWRPSGGDGAVWIPPSRISSVSEAAPE